MTSPIDITNGLPNARPSRAIPKPFQRKRIEVGQKGPKREWRWVNPLSLREGDVLPQFGTVAAVMGVLVEGDGFYVDIWGGEDNEMRVPEEDQVWAFVFPPVSVEHGESEVALHVPEA